MLYRPGRVVNRWVFKAQRRTGYLTHSVSIRPLLGLSFTLTLGGVISDPQVNLSVDYVDVTVGKPEQNPHRA